MNFNCTHHNIQSHRIFYKQLFQWACLMLILLAGGIILVRREYDLLPMLLPMLFFWTFCVLLGKLLYVMFLPGIITIGLTSFLRFILLPLINIIFSADILDPFFYQGIWGLVYESFMVCVFIWWLARYRYSKLKNEWVKQRDTFKFDLTSGLVFPLFLAIAIGCITPSILEDYQFVFNIQAERLEHAEYQGISSFVVRLGKDVLVVLLCTYFLQRFVRTRRILYFIFALLVVFLLNFCIIFGYSRYSILFPSMAGLFFILWIVPDYRRIVFFAVGILMAIILLLVSIMKNQQHGNVQLDVNYVNNYFAGPPGHGSSIALAEEADAYDISFETFCNDLFYNVAGLSKMFDGENRTAVYYNSIRETFVQIIPTIGQGFIYFGFILGILPELLYLLIIYYFDDKMLHEKRGYGIYYFTLFAIQMGFYYFQNISIATGFLLTYVLWPGLLLLADSYYRRYIAKLKLLYSIRMKT